VVPIATTEPNDLWTADFKGQFRTGTGVYCYPLTIADQHTRYLLTCHGLLSTETLVAKPVFYNDMDDIDRLLEALA
jgi:putative transposase